MQGMVKYCNREWKKCFFLLRFFEISQKWLKLLLKKLGETMAFFHCLALSAFLVPLVTLNYFPKEFWLSSAAAKTFTNSTTTTYIFEVIFDNSAWTYLMIRSNQRFRQLFYSYDLQRLELIVFPATYNLRLVHRYLRLPALKIPSSSCFHDGGDNPGL